MQSKYHNDLYPRLESRGQGGAKPDGQDYLMAICSVRYRRRFITG